MGRDWLKFTARQQARSVERAFVYWRQNGFPYIRLNPSEINNELSWLLRASPDSILMRSTLSVSTVGLRLANFFHPQMWHVPVHDYKTPFDRYQDDFCLRDCIRKALRFFPDRNSLNAQCLRSTLRIYRGTTRVSNFRPTVARAFCARFSGPGETILDFSAGYGGRLLGCLSLPRRYVGIDPCAAQVEGLRTMTRVFRDKLPGSAQIIKACAEDYLEKLPPRSVDLIFSSPPYFNHERYSTEASQSYLRYPEYPQWRKMFLERVLLAAFDLLKPRGFLILNVADPPGIPLIADSLRILKRHLRLHETVAMPLYRLPLQRAMTQQAFKHEPIFVFRKR